MCSFLKVPGSRNLNERNRCLNFFLFKHKIKAEWIKYFKLLERLNSGTSVQASAYQGKMYQQSYITTLERIYKPNSKHIKRQRFP